MNDYVCTFEIDFISYTGHIVSFIHRGNESLNIKISETDSLKLLWNLSLKEKTTQIWNMH